MVFNMLIKCPRAWHLTKLKKLILPAEGCHLHHMMVRNEANSN